MLEIFKENLIEEEFINKLERRLKLEVRSLRITINQYSVFASLREINFFYVKKLNFLYLLTFYPTNIAILNFNF